MQVDVVDWSSRKAFSAPMSMATASTSSLSTVVVSPIPIDFNILSYHGPIKSFKDKMQEPKCIPAKTEPLRVPAVGFYILSLFEQFFHVLRKQQVISSAWCKLTLQFIHYILVLFSSPRFEARGTWRKYRKMNRRMIWFLFVFQVHFPDDAHLVIVIEFDDDTESKETRTCYWEIFARDRARFKDRIEQASTILNPILEKAHRDQIYAKFHSSGVESESATSAIPFPSSSTHEIDEPHELNGGSESCISSSTGKKSRRKRRKCRSQRK